MIPVVDSETGISLGYFKDGAYISKPDVNTLIKQIAESIDEHYEGIRKCERLLKICYRIEKFDRCP